MVIITEVLITRDIKICPETKIVLLYISQSTLGAIFYRSRKIQAVLVAWKPNPDISMGFMRSSIRYVLTFQLTHTKRVLYFKTQPFALKKKKLVVKTELFSFLSIFFFKFLAQEVNIVPRRMR